MTTKRPLQASDQAKVYVFDNDYRCDPRDRPDLYDQTSLTVKEQPNAPTIDQNTNALDEQSMSQLPKEDTNGSTMTYVFPDDFPVPLNSIKEYITEKDGDTYIPLHSTVVLKKRQRMLYLPLELEITMDGLIDLGAFVNAMSEYNAIEMNIDICVIKEYPQPPFKLNVQMPSWNNQ